MSELTRMSAAQAAAALAAGSISARDLTGAYLARIEAHNAHFNAYVHVDASGALAQAAASDERRVHGRALHPLDGIPFGIKDNIAVAGLPLTAGMATRRGHVATDDAYCVTRLRRAGAVILGKLNLPEGALGADSDNPHFGACHNPHRWGYSAGGSSAGSAAALAARLCLLSLGSDTMGSVRIPAAYCGVVGLKPSFGRVSQRGLLRASRHLDHVGPMARSVFDLAPVFQQISGVDVCDASSRVVPLAHSERNLAALRVGVLGDLALHGVAPEIAAQFACAVAQIAQMAPRQHPVSFCDVDFGRMRRAGLLMCEAELNIEFALDLETQPHLISNALAQMLAFARSKSAVELAQAQARVYAAVLKARQVFASVDVLLTPTTPQAAFPLGMPAPVSQADLTSFANFAGLPALSLPMGRNAAGLPLGLQLIGPPGSDLQLMALGEHIEVALGPSACPLPD